MSFVKALTLFVNDSGCIPDVTKDSFLRYQGVELANSKQTLSSCQSIAASLNGSVGIIK